MCIQCLLLWAWRGVRWTCVAATLQGLHVLLVYQSLPDGTSGMRGTHAQQGELCGLVWPSVATLVLSVTPYVEDHNAATRHVR
jgi:hypothetical protein